MLNLDKNKTYLLACSFGPDSMALFKLLLDNEYRFYVAHVNYHLRSDSDKETEGLSNFCQKYQIKLFIKDVQSKIEKNIEEKCREIRYQFFADIINQNKEIDSVLVGHHQDDLLETYLLQKQRKILPNHYGLKEQTEIFGVKVIRPLLDYKKCDLEAFCKENDIPFALDYTNFLDVYQRNRIRHQVIEKMSDLDRDNLLKEIEKENEHLLILYKKLDGLNNLTNKEILALDNDLFRLYLTKIAKEVQPDFEVSNKVARQIKNVLTSDKPNIVSPINKELNFYKEYETCFFDYDLKENDYFYVMENPSILDTPYFHADFTGDTSNRNINKNDYPLIIRNAKNDDVIKINDYSVKVRRLFIDWKMPSSFRKRWPIILNKDNVPIYIPRYQSDFTIDEKCNFYVSKRFSLKKR